MAATAGLALAAGLCLGRGPRWAGRVGLIVGMALLMTWVWLMRHPAIAVQMMPVSLLSRIEGTGATPFFLLIVGVAWGQSQLARQRRLATLAMVLGMIYFLHGGLWLLQSTPSVGFAQTVSSQQSVMQSQDYSCVAAACATALNTLGFEATEAQMAQLTNTRPGTGATMIRAMAGLTRRLAKTDYRVTLLDTDYAGLMKLPMPALTPLQYEATRQHMVTLLEIKPDTVVLADPMGGVYGLPRPEFEASFIGQVLVFAR